MSLLAAAFCLALAVPQEGADLARWIRYPAISPDGTHVAFSYAGDLWVVALEQEGDGPREAELLTTHVGYERSPVWAPDSRTIAFAADWHGQMDVFVTTIDRAPARRLTFHSASDEPVCFAADGQEIWFTSRRQDTVEARIGSAVLSELYAIGVEGGAPRQLLTTPAERASVSPDGGLVAYQDLKGYEDAWRKHHVSSHARDLWVWNPSDGTHRKLTDFRGEDRDPVWTGDGRTLAFLSERGGTMNVWVLDADSGAAAAPLTTHETHPVRFLSASNMRTLAYAWDGELWIRDGQGSRKVPIRARVDQRTNLVERQTLREDATEMAVSPNEKEVAFVARGEVFVASLEHGTTRRVTTTPEQERTVSWGKDNRTLYYAGERDGSWNLYRSTIVRDEEEGFSSSTLLEETALLTNENETFQPLVAPDGKSVAYLRNRDELRVLDLESMESRRILEPDSNYSYQDGDIHYAWSPDSLWLTFTYSPYRRYTTQAGIANVVTGEITNVSESGYDVGSPDFSPDGKVVYYRSGRFGQVEQSGRGGQSDILAVYLTQAAYDDAQLSWEDFEREKERRAERKKEQEKAEKKAKKDAGEDADEAEEDDDDEKKEDAVEPCEVELRGLDDRRHRLTLQSAPIGSARMTPDGEAVLYFAEVDGKWDVWTSHIRDRKTQRLVALGDDGSGSLHLTKDGKTLVILTEGGKLKKAKISQGEHDLPESAKVEGVAFAAELAIDGPAERRHLFEHVWRQVREKFYRADLHGVDWDAMKVDYASYLPHVYNGVDLAELLSEMLGELNASHTGARYRPRIADKDDTASLGLLFGELTDEGLLVDEVLAGGPVDRAASKIEAGVRITAIDGEPLTPAANPWPLLDRKSKKPVLLSVRASDGTTFDEVVKPIASMAERELMYQRWIDRCEALVAELSEGRVGYVHVRGMNDSSYREVYEAVLGRNSDKEALVVDTRWNGGGWLHDQLVTFLGGDPYCTFVPRDKEPGRFGGEPLSRWSRPVCVVQNEGNYSDAHFFPYSFRTLKLGKLIGSPVAGTTTAVWWERLMDGATVFGIPQLGVIDRNGEYLENQELFPDIEVYNDPESTAAGRDLQLEAAVRHMLEEVEAQGAGSGN